MRRNVITAVLLAASLLTASGADPVSEIPDSAKSDLAKALRAKADEIAADPTTKNTLKLLETNLKSAKNGGINPSLKTTKGPEKLGGSITFPSQAAKDAMISEYESLIAANRDPIDKVLTAPGDYAPEMSAFKSGAFGKFLMPTATVERVIDKASAVVRLSILIPGPKPEVRKVDLLLANVDTKDFADNMPVKLGEVYYCTGNAKAGTKTYMRVIPFRLSRADYASTIGEKKK